MEVLNTILTVIFILNSLLLVTFILLQTNRSSGASLFGASSQSAFGASSADALTKMTAALVGVFIVLAMAMAFMRSKANNVDAIKKEFSKGNQSVTVPAVNEKNTDAQKAASTQDETVPAQK